MPILALLQRQHREKKEKKKSQKNSAETEPFKGHHLRVVCIFSSVMLDFCCMVLRGPLMKNGTESMIFNCTWKLKSMIRLKHMLKKSRSATFYRLFSFCM